MANSELIVGLDLGTTKTSVIVGRKNEYGKLDILGIGNTSSYGLSRGVVTNIDRTVEAITQSVEEASKRSDVEIESVNVGISGNHLKSIQTQGVKVRNNNDKEITQEDVDFLIDQARKTITDPGEKVVHVYPQEFTIDSESCIKDPVGMAGVRMEGDFHIISANISAARNIKRCVTKSGLNMDAMTVEPIASGEAVLSEEEKEAGVALVDIGGGSTDVVIYKDNIIRHTAIIPFGGNIVTSDIKEGCNIMYKKAESLKVQFGSAVPDETHANELIVIEDLKGREPREISSKNLACIIEARISEVFNMVFGEIKNSGYENQLIGGIVVTGGGANLQHIAQAVEYYTGFDTRVGFPNEHLANGMTQEVNDPKFSTPIGLILEGFKQEQKPESLEKPKKDKENNEGWFQNLFKKGKKWLEDDDLDDYEK